MNISGLDITLRRISQIETKFGGNINTPNTSTASFDNILKDTLNKNNKTNTNSINDNEINSLVEKYAKENNLDSSLVNAVIKAESNFNSDARSKVGAQGLMQLMPATAKSLGVEDAFNPEQNIKGGTKYLSNMLDRFNGNKKLALAAYNAGPNAVNEYNGVPPYEETQNYVKKVIDLQKQYKGA